MKLIKRLITGTILFSLILFAIYQGNIFFNLIILAISLLNLYEINKIKGNLDLSFTNIFILSLYAIIFTTLFIPFFEPFWESIWLQLLFLAVILLTVYEFFKNKYFFIKHKYLSHVHSLLLITVGFPFLILIRNLENGLFICLFIFFIVTTADSIAYFIGKFFGRHHISEISPKKTWEGSFAGLLSSIIVSIIFSLLYSQFEFLTILIFGLFISIIAQYGDFYESLIKRSYSVKDSSKLLPGHGGFLDRTDSYLFLFPLVYYFHRYFL